MLGLSVRSIDRLIRSGELKARRVGRRVFLSPDAAEIEQMQSDRIRERIGQVKADQKARGRYLGGKVPFGFRLGEGGELVPHQAEQEAIREMIALRGGGKPLRAIATAAQAKGHKISHEGVASVLRAATPQI